MIRLNHLYSQGRQILNLLCNFQVQKSIGHELKAGQRGLATEVNASLPGSTLRPLAISPLPSTLQAWLRDFHTNEPLDIIELDRKIFGIPLRRDIIHRVIVWQRNKSRQGTHSTKGRSEVSGTTRKAFVQKGRGKARVGSLRAPQFRKGGIAHGPKPRSHATLLPRQVQLLGLRTALSTKYAQDDLIVVNSINLPSPKTQQLLSLFSHHSWDPLADDKLLGNSLLFLSEINDKNLTLAMRNLKRVHGLTVQEIFDEADVYNIIGHEKVVIDLGAVRKLEELLREPSVLPRDLNISLVDKKAEEMG